VHNSWSCIMWRTRIQAGAAEPLLRWHPRYAKKVQRTGGKRQNVPTPLLVAPDTHGELTPGRLSLIKQMLRDSLGELTGGHLRIDPIRLDLPVSKRSAC
jgi:hypothetical protein